MSDALTREEAARLLEVALPCTPGQAKRAYRRLARQHHPDRGGDPRRFHAIQAAYQRLSADGPAPPAAPAARPSRTPRTVPSTPSRIAVDALRTDLPLPAGRVRLTGHLLASALARPHPAPVHPVLAVSRAPGAVLNRAAGVLAADLTSHLVVAPGTDDRGEETVMLEVRSGARQARRALDGVDLGGVWLRRRGTATTVLTASVPPDADRTRTAATAAAQLERLLAALDWPLEQWTLTVETGAVR
ncbi:MAG: DnaJ domain-containing protein [Nitriliruptoraceae bacterium]